MTKVKIQLMEVLMLEHAQKLYAIDFNFLFKHYTVQDDWLFQTRNHLGKFQKQKVEENLRIWTST